MTSHADVSLGAREANKAAATRFIHGFNDDDWDAVRRVVAAGFVFHHPLGGTVAAGPDGMVSTWAGFKQLSPDSWHPIPVMIADGDYVAVLLPTFGTFTGHGEHAPPPTGGRLDYGMVNIVRLENGMLAEMWFGMDSLAEMQQLGVAPPAEQRTAQGTSLGAFMGLPPTGRRVEFTGVTMFRVEGGKLAEIWDTRNTLGILHQLDPELGAGGHHH